MTELAIPRILSEPWLQSSFPMGVITERAKPGPQGISAFLLTRPCQTLLCAGGRSGDSVRSLISSAVQARTRTIEMADLDSSTPKVPGALIWTVLCQCHGEKGPGWTGRRKRWIDSSFVLCHPQGLLRSHHRTASTEPLRFCPHADTLE